MRPEIKFGIFIGIIVLGLGAWYVSKQEKKTPPAEIAPVESVTPAPDQEEKVPPTPLPTFQPKKMGRITLKPPSTKPATATQPVRYSYSRQPTPPTTQPATQPVKPMKIHVVRPGETYSSLAMKYFGHAKYASLIAKANPGKDARHLYIGTKLNIPPLPSRGSTPSVALSPIPPDRAYKVKPGEAWTDLAKRFLGDGNRWPELYELNRERVPRNYNILPAGTVIELPKGIAAQR